ncbi:MAG: hypothetical protein JWO82_1387 [Akkermansiaceae bacterium]|nr:hypothetical protein [Akkermansiaceae bacterium]
MISLSLAVLRTGRGMLLVLALAPGLAAAAGVLGTDELKAYIDEFRADDRWYFDVATDAEVSTQNNGTYGGQAVKNADAYDYLKDRIPLLDVPSGDIEKTYYYRWWTYRKHIKNIGTAAAPNRIVTEYIDPVDWADTTNAIAAPSGHHLYEGRWLDDPDLMRDYIRYWMANPAANPRRYSAWLADGVLARQKVVPDDDLIAEMVSSTTNPLNLARNWLAWQGGTNTPGGTRQQAYYAPEDGLFWQNDDRDAMEYSFGGSGRRPSINSYLYGDARAIAEMYRIAANRQPANESALLASAAQFDARADDLRDKIQSKLWDPATEFFKTGYGPNGSRPPNGSMDYGIRRHTWWSAEHLGTQEWVQYDFPNPVTLNRTEVYFFDDQASGGASRVPASWKLQYWDGSQWLDCATREGDSYATQLNAFNVVRLAPVQTSKLRLLAQTQPGQSAGTLEWRVFAPTGENVAFSGIPSASYTDTWGGTVLALNDENPVGYNQQARREEIGLTPWYFHLPQAGGPVDYNKAWSHLGSFDTPFGFATGGKDETGYYSGDLGNCCLWNGPVWPFASSITLTAMANLLHDYQQPYVSRTDYLSRFTTYALSQRFTLIRNGESRPVAWIDETLASGGNTGGMWSHIGGYGQKPGPAPRGFSYNHSTFADLVITGLIGLKPRSDSTVEVDPLLPVSPGGDYPWAYFCLDRVPYHGRHLTIIYDRDGSRYQRGAGLSIYADGLKIASAPKAGKLTAELPGPVAVWAKDFFPASVALGDLAATADPDGDGFTNALEYLCGTDPSSAASTPQIQTTLVTDSGVSSLALKASLRDAAAEGVTYGPEYSSDLVNWNSAVFVESPPEAQANGMSLHTYRCTVTNPPAATGFLRLNVQEK